MVNFNSDATVAVPRADIISLLVLEKRELCIQAIGLHSKASQGSGGADPRYVHEKILELWLEVQPSLKEEMEEEKYKALLEKIISYDVKKLTEAFLYLNEWLYKKKITKFDLHKSYNRGRMEEENNVHSL